MDARLPDNFDAQQVSLFLDKIARECETELRQIACQRDDEIARIRGDAHAESRRLFRHGAAALRARLALERDRYLARVRSELRRRRWDILSESQQRVLEAVAARFSRAWEDPERQWEWCRYWLELALERAGDDALAVTLGQGALDSVRARIEARIGAHRAGASVTVDPDAAPGISIEWDDYVMDGRLGSQSAAITDAVLARLSGLLHAPGAESGQ